MIQKVACIFSCVPSVVSAASCPTGMVAVEYDTFVPAVGGACPAGYVAHATETVCGAGDGACWLLEQIRALCSAGITKLKTSGGLSIPLYSEKSTSPSIHIKYNNTVCYADLEQGTATGSVHVKYNKVVYHTAEE